MAVRSSPPFGGTIALEPFAGKTDKLPCVRDPGASRLTFREPRQLGLVAGNTIDLTRTCAGRVQQPATKLRPSSGEAHTMAEPSAELVRRAQAGEESALVALVQSQQTYVYSIALGIMHNPQDAADMTQDAFIRLLRSLPTYRGETKFTTWLYRLVTNICLDGLRRKGRPVDSLDVREDDEQALGDLLADSDRWAQPEDRSEWRESAGEVREALARLPEAQRLALTLHYFEEMRYEEIADVMGLPLNTVKSHIRRGKERLGVLLQASAQQEEMSWTVAQ